VVIGGFGADAITLTNGDDVVIGDDGQVNDNYGGGLSEIQTTDPTVGGNDTITTGGGDDYLLGGAGADIIAAGNGDNAIIGDNGAMYFCNWNPRSYDDYNWIDFNQTILSSMTSTSPSIGGGDTITAGAGQNVIIGGAGADAITAGNGGNTVIGDNGNVSFLSPGVVGVVETSDPSYGGNDVITTGTGNDRILGGVGSDTIHDSGGGNVIFGDDGILTFVDDHIEGDSGLLAFGGLCSTGSNGWIIYSDGLLVSAVSTDPTVGGTDAITTGAGQDLVVGGAGSDTISAGDGQNIVVGDNGQITYCGAGFLESVQSIYPSSGTGNDVISVGAGNNIIVAGLGADKITGGNGENIVFGDDGQFTYSNFNRYSVRGQPWDVVQDCVYAEAVTLDPSLGGNDTITLGTGHNVIFGGAGNDIIKTSSGNNIIFGGDGQVVFSSGGWVTDASSNNTNYSGTDTIYNGTSTAVVLSGRSDQEINTLQFPVWQMESGPAPAGEDTSPALVQSQLDPIVVEAEAIWAKVLGPDSARLAILNGITVQVGDLPAGMIGATVGDAIYIDGTAAGWGWFIDPTSAGDSEFRATSITGVLTAAAGSNAAGHMDLLSTVLHELGNAMGFPEDTGQDVTGKVLEPGERRLPVLPSASGAAAKVPSIDWTAINTLTQNTTTPFDTEGLSWVDNFLNDLGADGKHHRPNAGLRIKPQVS
jgi:Ca2+-binding RTX toxin-like protein